MSFQLFGRRGCHLCELMIEKLLELSRGSIDVDVHDIDGNAELLQKYDLIVPVLEFDGRVVCKTRLDEDAVFAILATRNAQ